jgi:LPXTG-site transpeptidase (sortase) family protein
LVAKDIASDNASSVDRNVEGLCETARRAMRETSRQYSESFADSMNAFNALHVEGKSLWKRAKEFLLMPVWIPSRKKKMVEHSRVGLFFIDVVRFGGTFAGIFIVLFSAMNYESLWGIITPKVAALLAPPSIDGASTTLNHQKNSSLANAAANVPSRRRRSPNFLPDVGPPDNMLIIEKLGLHVPLVEPPTKNLLEENWPKVEEDIQNSLLHGAVLYPGTARPGQAGNAFITAHSSYYAFVSSKYKSIFARLGELSVGDEYWIYYGGDRHRYVVQSKKIVKPSDISVLDQPLNQRISTLMTCWPVGTTLSRQVILAQEVDPSTGIAMHVGEKAERTATKVKLEALPI